jgi:hypothetical protein
LHGLGDLLRRLGGGDAIAQVFKRRHSRLDLLQSADANVVYAKVLT